MVTCKIFCYSTFKVLNSCRLRCQSTRRVKTDIKLQTFRVANFPSVMMEAASSALVKGSTTLSPRTNNGSSPQQRIFPSPTTVAEDPGGTGAFNPSHLERFWNIDCNVPIREMHVVEYALQRKQPHESCHRYSLDHRHLARETLTLT